MDNTRLVLIAILAIVFSVVVGKMITTTEITIQVAIIFSIVFAVIAFHNPLYGLYILVFSMLLSPEIKLAQLPKRSVVVRIDDFLLVALVIAWIANMAVKKELALIKKTPLNMLMTAFTVIAVVFTERGVMLGYINFVKSSFYVLKYVEYFFLYFLVTNIVSEKDQFQKLLTAALITFLIVGVFCYAHIGRVPRLYAPFDVDPIQGTGEPASLAGYMLIVLPVLLSFYCYAPTARLGAFYLALFIFAMPVFLFTFSRSSFLAFIPMYFSIILFSEKKKYLLILLLVGGFLITPILFPSFKQNITERLSQSFVSQGEEGGPPQLINIKVRERSSADLRILSWKKAITKWVVEQPFMGYGISGVGIVDAQYPLFVGEIGITGLLVFLLLLYAIGKNAFIIFKNSTDWIQKSMSLGLLTSLIALIFQGLAVNAFIIVRIMEPFWFLTALVMISPYYFEEQDKLAVKKA